MRDLEREADPENRERPGVLILMPKDVRQAVGPVSVWLTAAGWADAATELYGRAWLATPSGVFQADEARRLATLAPSRATSRRRLRRLVPQVVGTLRKDLLTWRMSRDFQNAGLHGPWELTGLAWVWHHHEPFHRSGFITAERFGCPVVVFVDAPAVWEARQWGVRRPGWGRIVERFGERPQLRDADLVACVTEEVAEQVVRLGADPARVLVTPCAVDTGRFHTGVDGTVIRSRFGLEDKTVIGWVGTFHKFHGLDLLLEAYGDLERDRDDVALMLVGDGQDRPRTENRIAELGLRTVLLTGPVPQDDVPVHIAAMDIAAVVDPGTSSFHYSPLKLKEYLACGCAVVAPASGQISRFLERDRHAILIPPGDVKALVDALRGLIDNPEQRRALGLAGSELIGKTSTWLHQVQAVDDALAMHGSRQ